jgi:hypothetical protein
MSGDRNPWLNRRAAPCVVAVKHQARPTRERKETELSAPHSRDAPSPDDEAPRGSPPLAVPAAGRRQRRRVYPSERLANPRRTVFPINPAARPTGRCDRPD